MKILHQDIVGPMTVSYYNWNGKFIVKIELDAYEQTYKINEMDVNSLEKVKELIHTNHFLTKVFERFQSMDEDLSSLLN
ncbi:MAG: hypothetical protein U0V72_07370 [Cytophagales bacterium]